MLWMQIKYVCKQTSNSGFTTKVFGNGTNIFLKIFIRVKIGILLLEMQHFNFKVKIHFILFYTVFLY